MRWEDESWVKLYRRRSPSWLSMSIAARGIFTELLREVDRAGVLETGRIGLKAIAVISHVTWAEAEAPIRELVEEGCIVVSEGRIVIPNYLEAQDATSSTAARKREQRERARSSAMSGIRAEMSRNVTVESQNVTNSHAESRGVTRESRIEEKRIEERRREREATSSPTAPLALVPPPPESGVLKVSKPKREKKVKGETTPPPPDSATPAEVEFWCHDRSLPSPSENAEVMEMLDWHRRKAQQSGSWPSSWRSWQRNQVKFARSSQSGAYRTAAVRPQDIRQAVDMEADYIKNLLAEGT